MPLTHVPDSAISGCYALMPTREEALAELQKVLGMIAEEHRESACGVEGILADRCRAE